MGERYDLSWVYVMIWTNGRSMDKLSGGNDNLL